MKEKIKRLTTPLSLDKILKLSYRECVALSGIIYTARDQAHKRLVDLIIKNKPLPFMLNGSVIYYCGPTPTPPGEVIGSCGPTSSYRLDNYLEPLFKRGLRATIGKGERSAEAYQLHKKYKVIYFTTWAGCGAYLSQFVKAKKLIAFPELGPEAIYQLEVENFPLIVLYCV